MLTTNDTEVDLDLVVHARRMLTPDIVALDLRANDGALLPYWSPGAHVEMNLGNGLSRQYSLCGDPADRQTWTVAVLREPSSRGGSDYIHDNLPTGTSVKSRGPRNNFPLEPASEYRFVAGGIGITPMLPMIRAAEVSGTPWTLLYGGRSLESMAFRDELSNYGDKVTFHPQDTHGLLPLATDLADPTPGAAVYCCGPEPLLVAIENLCESSWPAGALHVERFRADLPDLADAREIEVELAQSGMTLTVPPDKTILEVLTDAGVTVDASCEEGTCGTCEVVVLEGTPEHHDVVLTESERESGECMMICVSRAKGRCLKLDV
ncbi:PDR/VanB family oxidoreductase [Rhodococcus oxybenzonivorans]|uniref:PDR/VanB family oxidoreductase n=1 Tax=Rhodococcus oxybenzonivorans TaxID=1990687 RepID=UPI002952F809|nr:PDR/VanB family oxidoreductase [Rhodococcus oxybenzonivorans]MDV7353510.1 PDR/VanB family oxidoreductase [Rhodococcus oxybenzonivorans]